MESKQLKIINMKKSMQKEQQIALWREVLP